VNGRGIVFGTITGAGISANNRSWINITAAVLSGNASAFVYADEGSLVAVNVSLSIPGPVSITNLAQSHHKSSVEFTPGMSISGASNLNGQSYYCDTEGSVYANGNVLPGTPGYADAATYGRFFA